MASHASHMLEAALEQMDDIIAGSKAAADFSGGLFERGSPGCPGPQRVLRLAEDLRAALEMQAVDGDRVLLRKQLPSTTADILIQWLERGMANLQSPVNNETCQDRLSRLEGDKESLVLQVSVLTEQVEAQGEKIRDLESSLDEHQNKLCSTEEMLQEELFSRTSLETEKLDLIDEVSHLKLKLVGMEDQPSEGDSKQHKAECVVNLISELQEQMCKFQLEISSRIEEKRALEKQATDSSLQEAHQSPNPDLGSSEDRCRCRGENGLFTELKLLKSKVDELQEEKCEYEKKLKATKSLMTKLSSLKLTVEHTQVERQQWEDQCRTAQAEISDLQQLLAEKDAEIDCLQRQLSTRGPSSTNGPEKALTLDEVYKRRLKDKYQELQRLKMGMETLLAENKEKGRRIDELTVLLSQCKKTTEDISLNQVSGARILAGNSEEELNMDRKMRGLGHKSHPDTPQSEMSSNGSSSLLVSSSSFQRELDFSHMYNEDGAESDMKTATSKPSDVEMSPVSVFSPSKTSVQNGPRIKPRTLSGSLEELRSGSKKKHAVEEPVEPVVSAETPQIDDSNKCQTLPGKVSRSSQNGKREKHSTPIQKSPNQSRDKAFALNRCRSASAPALGKAEKTDEATFSDLSLPSSGNDSKLQSAVSPDNRKNHNALHKFWGKDMNTPFSKWTKEQVCGWLEDYGLGQYVNLARQWVNTGQTLLSATPQQLEKEMGIKHALHRKKLQLAIRSFNTKVIEKSSELDHFWVTRWLDDIGLPQYKDQFNEGRVDGRMIQYLTVNDLLFMKVTSQFHHLSIKCAIHVLHINKFNPHCLRRRPGDENKTSPSEVMQWSNHRVMEWLRSVDLAEYAPNLRGSGVHGGLIILEPRFNTETLAMLLNIPPQKTLLRRHLATNFSSLVGPQAQQEKRDAIQASGHTPLTTTAKVRPKKLGFTSFGHLRKKKLDDSTDYVCPLDTLPPPLNGAIRSFSGFRGLSPILDRDREKKDQVGQKSGCQPASTHHR